MTPPNYRALRLRAGATLIPLRFTLVEETPVDLVRLADGQSAVKTGPRAIDVGVSVLDAASGTVFSYDLRATEAKTAARSVLTDEDREYMRELRDALDGHLADRPDGGATVPAGVDAQITVTYNGERVAQWFEAATEPRAVAAISQEARERYVALVQGDLAACNVMVRWETADPLEAMLTEYGLRREPGDSEWYRPGTGLQPEIDEYGPTAAATLRILGESRAEAAMAWAAHRKAMTELDDARRLADERGGVIESMRKLLSDAGWPTEPYVAEALRQLIAQRDRLRDGET